MRKLAISLVILLIAGGTAFYFGWVQLQIPANSYGVVFTKTGGWDTSVIRPGEFHWRWERLLPTNFTLHIFPSTPHATSVRASGTLPSAEVYAGYLEDNPDFSYELELSLAYRVRPAELPRLVREEDLQPAGLDDWYTRHDQRMVDRARGLAGEFYADVPGESAGPVQLDAFEEELTDRLAEAFPDLEIISAVPTTISLPDFSLYEAGRSLYFDSIDARRSAIAEQAYEAEERRVTEESRLETLRRYGEVLTEYPTLLDYFSLTAEQGVDPLDLEAIREPSPPQISPQTP
ncbi:MAG: hypothetical protein GVY23_08375 [Spirochaetes bacterium]|jgi:hypothetical protein|nr:hypothetical protein [Spirochaetota bacterium]